MFEGVVGHPPPWWRGHEARAPTVLGSERLDRDAPNVVSLGQGDDHRFLSHQVLGIHGELPTDDAGPALITMVPCDVVEFVDQHPQPSSATPQEVTQIQDPLTQRLMLVLDGLNVHPGQLIEASFCDRPGLDL